MKKIYLLSIAAILSVAVMLVSCHKEDETKPEPEPNKEEPNQEEPNQEEPKIQYDSSEVFMLLTVPDYSFFNPDANNPKDGETNCRYFNYPLSIALKNHALYQPFEIKVLDTLSYTYRYQIKNYTITNGAGEDMAGEYVEPESGTTVACLPHKEFKPNTEYTVLTTVILAQLVDGKWKPVIYKNSTKEYTCSVKFTTGNLPGNKIESEDIMYQYPIDRQLFYLPEQYKLGYIMLGYSYQNIFNGVAKQDMKIIVSSISDETESKQETGFTYKNDIQGTEINYSLENVTFKPQAIYRFDFLCGEDTIYNMHFATSKYPDMESKFADISSEGFTIHHSENSLVFDIEALEQFELFDGFELKNKDIINGYKTFDGLVRFEMDFKNSEGFHNSIYEYIYDNFTDVLKNSTSNRVEGYPPSSCFYDLQKNYARFKLSDSEIQNKQIDNTWRWYNVLYCSFYRIMCDDFNIIKNYITNPTNEMEEEIVSYRLYWEMKPPYLPTGSYKCWFYYQLPGKNTIIYKKYFDINK